MVDGLEKDLDDGLTKCPECKGTGKVLLLVSFSRCPDCGGTGIKAVEFDEEGVPEDPIEDEDTGEFPMGWIADD